MISEDHVTLKTGVNDAENTAVITEIYLIVIILYSRRKTVVLNCNNIYNFLLYFLSNKFSLGEQKTHLKMFKYLKILTVRVSTSNI